MSGYDVSSIALTMKRKLADERGDGKRARLAEDEDEDALAALADEMEDEVGAHSHSYLFISVYLSKPSIYLFRILSQGCE
jgi:hypothetical protein